MAVNLEQELLQAKRRIAKLEKALTDLLTYPDAELSRKAAENVLAKLEASDDRPLPVGPHDKSWYG